MPKYRVFLIEDPDKPDDRNGSEQVWNLPWERLVFDQRIEYRPEGAGAKGLYRIAAIHETDQGTVYDMILDPGNRTGGDPKKDRPPYMRS